MVDWSLVTIIGSTMPPRDPNDDDDDEDEEDEKDKDRGAGSHQRTRRGRLTHYRVDALELASGGEMSASRCGECAHMPYRPCA